MSIETYECARCGDSFGIAGTSTGSADDLAADDYYASEVEFHQSGLCVVVVEPAPDPRAEYIAGLRALADLLEQHDDIALPVTGGSEYQPISWVLTLGSEDEQKAAASHIVRTVGGNWRKRPGGTDGYLLCLNRTLVGLHVEVMVHRNAVCRRIVTGVETVTEQVPVEFEERTRKVEQVEWICEPLLAEAVSS